MSSKQIIFILPGFLGTHLKSEMGTRIWFSPLMLLGGMKKLSLTKDNIQTDGLVEYIYADLKGTLEENNNYEVHAYPIDWRKSLRAQGKEFSKFVKTKALDHDVSITIIAHSQGGLLAQSAIADSLFLKNKMEKDVSSKFIMLGTPVYGTYIVAHLLLGKEWFGTLPIFDGTLWENSVREILSKYGGLLDLMPADDPLDLFSDKTWKTLYDLSGINARYLQKEDLDSSKEFRTWLNKNPINNQYTFYIRGERDATPSGLKIEKRGSKSNVIFEHTNYGDAVSEWASSKDIDNTFHASGVHHAFLPRTDVVISTISELIENKPTSLPKVVDGTIKYKEKTTSTTTRSVIPPFPV